MKDSNVIDFSEVRRGYRGYSSGSLKLQSIIYRGEYYLLKYPERNKKKTHEFQVSSYMNNSISEHIGSRIFESAGIPSQKTLLGKTGEDILVACKDFVDRDAHCELHEFSTVSKELYSSSEVGRYPPVDKVYEVIANHPVLSKIKDSAIRSYWDMQIVDALIGNFDRHTGNWGFVINVKTGEAKPAPIYDCGSSLWAKVDDAAIGEILGSQEHMDKLTFDLPRGRIQLNSESAKQNYIDFFSSSLDGNCTEALKRTVPRICLQKIGAIIDETPFISEKRAEFLKKAVSARYEKVLLEAYGALHGKKEKGRAAKYAPAPRGEELDRGPGADKTDGEENER